MATPMEDGLASKPATGGPEPATGSREPATGSPLDQQERESERAHRSFLLWAMQEPTVRNLSAAARAVGRAESTAREWRRRWGWDARVTALGAASDSQAIAAYRRWYYPKWKLREVVEVEEHLAAPFRPEAVVSPSVAAEVREQIRGTGPREAEVEARKKAKRRHMALVDGALGLVARRVAAGEVKVTLRDIPTLLDLRDRLEDPAAAAGHGGVVVESVRVRLARERGEDLIAALHEDAQELAAILGALRSSSDAASEIMAAQSAGGDR